MLNFFRPSSIYMMKSCGMPSIMEVVLMRILKNVTKQELGFYTNQLTAKAMHERTMRNSVYVPKDDARAAAVFVASRKAEKIPNQTDKVELSSAGQKISPNSTKNTTAKGKEDTPNISFSMSQRSNGHISLSFDNSAMVSRAVKQGYVEIDGRQVELSDDVKKQLIATNNKIQDAKEAATMHNMLLHEAANARQTSDAMKKANDKMSRVMTTAARIMHGKKVSPADEKELMEFNKDLYAMAKSAAALAEHHRKQDDKEDDKISKENEGARAREAEPKDYSVEETPLPKNEVQMEVSFEGDMPRVTAVGAGLSE